MKDKVIVTVVGKDKVGIIAGVTTALAQAGVNILDISQTIMQDFFTMIMICDMAEANKDLAGLKNIMEEVGNRIGVKITVQHEEVFQFMHRI
ncbi:MAG: ACT domain-containing protein [Bacillota bacterium]|jgi:ACT domain-containing protein|nr:ACT domain-containing protein [Clostridia bacterium]